MTNIHVDRYDDWIKVYVGDKLRYSEHSLSYRDWLLLLAEAGCVVTTAWNDTDGDGNVTYTSPIEQIGPAAGGER